MRACAPNVAIAPASSKTPSAREPTRSTSDNCSIHGLLPLLDHHPARSIQVNAILVFVLARHGVVVLGLHRDGDDLAAWQSLKRDHRRQILFERFLVGQTTARRRTPPRKAIGPIRRCVCSWVLLRFALEGGECLRVREQAPNRLARGHDGGRELLVASCSSDSTFIISRL